MIVDDHQGVRQTLREWLELSFPGYHLLEATSGEEGVTLAQAMAPCLVIMDIGLPGMSGIEAAKSIKAAVPATRVVMLTMFDDEAHRTDAARSRSQRLCAQAQGPNRPAARPHRVAER